MGLSEEESRICKGTRRRGTSGGSGGSGGMTGMRASSRTHLHGGGSGRGLRHGEGLVTSSTMERSRTASKGGGGGEISVAGAREIHLRGALGSRLERKQNVSIRVYGIKLNTNNNALFTTLFHLRHRPAVSDLAANTLSVRASIGSLLPDLRFKFTLIRMRVTNGSSNRRDGLSLSELLMSPEIFKAVNNGEI
ncbi:hypothetical protein YC2023_107791 [Brassica napus]